MSNNMFKFKSKPYRTVTAGQYSFTFFLNEKNLGKGKLDGTYLRISGREDRQFNMTIPGNSEACAYLLAAANQGETDQMQDYARLVFSVSMLCVIDQELTNDIAAALVAWQERGMADGAKQAQEVSDGQEQAEQAFMEDVAAFADATDDKEREALRAKWKEDIRKEIHKDA